MATFVCMVCQNTSIHVQNYTGSSLVNFEGMWFGKLRWFHWLRFLRHTLSTSTMYIKFSGFLWIRTPYKTQKIKPHKNTLMILEQYSHTYVHYYGTNFGKWLSSIFFSRCSLSCSRLNLSISWCFMIGKMELSSVRPNTWVASNFCRQSQKMGMWQKQNHL